MGVGRTTRNMETFGCHRRVRGGRRIKTGAGYTRIITVGPGLGLSPGAGLLITMATGIRARGVGLGGQGRMGRDTIGGLPWSVSSVGEADMVGALVSDSALRMWV